MMIYDLPLDLPITKNEGLKKYKLLETSQVGDKYLTAQAGSLDDFRDKLNWYNHNICSLSLLGMAGRVFLIWRPWEIPFLEKRVKLYCGCKSCSSLPNFNPVYEQTFLDLRAKEVSRLSKAISVLKSYEEKIKYLLSLKGCSLNKELRIYSNAPIDGTKDPDEDLLWQTPVIDLEPASQEERRIYNSFIKKDFDLKYKIGNEFSAAYLGFNFNKEKLRLDATLKGSADRERLIDYLKSKIEKRYGYPGSIDKEHTQNANSILLNNQIEELTGVVTNLFAKKVLGAPIDQDKNKLTEHAQLEYTHVSQIVEFYKYLKRPIATTETSTVQHSMNNNYHPFKTFDELFFSPELIEPSIMVLNQVRANTVTENLKTFLGPASMAVVWMQELKNKSFIEVSTNKSYAALLSNKFKGFSVDASMFGEGKISQEAEGYRNEIRALLQKLKN